MVFVLIVHVHMPLGRLGADAPAVGEIGNFTARSRISAAARAYALQDRERGMCGYSILGG